MTRREAEIIVSLAENDLNVTKVSEKLPYHRNTIANYMERIKKQTGADPRNFYDMCRLLPTAEGVLFGIERTCLDSECGCGTRCCECQYWLSDFGEVCSREEEWFYTSPDDFCSRGIRKKREAILQ